MKLRCVCDQDYIYDHTKAGQQFKCSWCGQLIVMPPFESLSPEDQTFYRNELQKQHEKAKRAAEKAERKQQAAAAKEAARRQKMQQEDAIRKKLEEEARVQQAMKAEKEKQYAEALAEAKAEPDKPKIWLCSVNQVQQGPMQEAMVQRWIDDGTLSARDYVRTQDSVTWVRVNDLPERFHFPPAASAASIASAVKCPRCGCTQLSSNKKGMDPGNACCGALLLGPLGLLCGLSGASKVIVTCLNCGHQWSRG